MVVDWEQETGLLMTSGDVRIIRIWDTDREMKVQVMSACLARSPFPSQSTSHAEGARARPKRRRLLCGELAGSGASASLLRDILRDK